MPKTPPISSSFKIPTDLNAIISFYTKQPLLAITAIVLPVLGIIGFIYLRSLKPIEDQIRDLITRGQLTDAYAALARKGLDIRKKDDLLDSISFDAHHENDNTLAVIAAGSIQDIDKKHYAICRLFNSYRSKKDLSMASSIANATHLNPDLQHQLFERVFLDYLAARQCNEAYVILRNKFVIAPGRDRLCELLFNLCLQEKDSATAQKAAEFMQDPQKRNEYLLKVSS